MNTRSTGPFLHVLTLTASLALNAAAFADDATKAVAETPLMTSKTTARIFDVDAPLKGAKELWLVVSDEGAMSCDWSDWIEPKLIIGTRDRLEWHSLKGEIG